MDRFKYQRRPKYDGEESPSSDFDAGDEDNEDGGTPEPFAGGKVRRKASRYRAHRGDYLHVSLTSWIDEDSGETSDSIRCILSVTRRFDSMHIVGDTSILFADKVLKFTGSGKMKRLEKMCLSKLSDNFFAIIIPTEYDLFMASTRKTELVQVMVYVTKSASDYDLDVLLSNSFEYNASSLLLKEVSFEEAEEGI